MNLPNFKHGLNIEVVPDFNFSKLTNMIFSRCITSLSSSSKEVKLNLFEKEGPHGFFESSADTQESDNIVWQVHDVNRETIILDIPKNISADINLDLEVNKNAAANILIIADSNSKANINLIHSSADNSSYLSENIRVIAKDNSILNISSIQNFGKNLVFFQKRRAMQGKCAEVNWIDLFVGGKYIHSDTINKLNNDLSKTNSKVLYFAKDEQKYDLSSSVLHYGKFTESNILIKGVVKDNSYALSRSLIRINPTAQNSKGYEKQEAIILSSNAQADAIPNLEIENDQVQCSHGSTIGKLDEERIFYLMSRGLSRNDATSLIIEGYFHPVISQLSDKSFASRIMGVISKHLNGN